MFKLALVALLGYVSAVNISQKPVTNHCTNANKATGVDQECSVPGQSAWNTITTARTGNPKDAQAAPYPDHKLH